jgi:hypothetical protein
MGGIARDWTRNCRGVCGAGMEGWRGSFVAWFRRGISGESLVPLML